MIIMYQNIYLLSAGKNYPKQRKENKDEEIS